MDRSSRTTSIGSGVVLPPRGESGNKNWRRMKRIGRRCVRRIEMIWSRLVIFKEYSAKRFNIEPAVKIKSVFKLGMWLTKLGRISVAFCLISR